MQFFEIISFLPSKEGWFVKTISTEKKLCLSCMEKHEVKKVEVLEENVFKGVSVKYPAKYEYCDRAEDYLTYEDTLESNDTAFKDAYRKEMGLLTSDEIIAIRKMYGVSQKDFSLVLGWGSSTITRYENHQVQDGVHDDVLRKVANDPKWFIELLSRARTNLTDKAYRKYLQKARELYHANRNKYLKESEEKTITGLVYNALPMGAVPEGHEALLLLDGVEYDEVQYDEHIGYRFKAKDGFQVNLLTESEIKAIDEVINRFKNYNAKEISDAMHEEEAYRNTPKKQPISFEYAQSLSI